MIYESTAYTFASTAALGVERPSASHASMFVKCAFSSPASQGIDERCGFEF